VLWWVPAGHRPSVEEAIGRMKHLKQHGPSDHTFGLASGIRTALENGALCLFAFGVKRTLGHALGGTRLRRFLNFAELTLHRPRLSHKVFHKTAILLDLRPQVVPMRARST
jgi:uncharacterized protein DUF3291